jgi:hypothetical protein
LSDRGFGTSLQRLVAWLPLAAAIEASWLQPRQQRAPGWLAHHDINAVMLATSLLAASPSSDGYLDLA